MKRYMMLTLWALILSILLCPASNAEGLLPAFNASNINSSFIIDEATNTLLHYDGNETSVEIPDGVKHIGNYAFYRSHAVTVTMPDSVVSIGDHAFSDCEELKQIKLSDHLLSIDSYAFYDCYSLEELLLPESLVYIGGYAFSWYDTVDGECPGYTSVTVPAGVVYISPEQKSFSGWTTGVTCPCFEIEEGNRFYRIEDGMLIGHGVLLNYEDPAEGNPLRIVTVPEDVTEIAPCAFANSHVLSVKLPDGLRKIGQAAFWACLYLMELTIDFETTEVGQGILFLSGFSEITDGEWMGTAKDTLKNYGYYDADGEYRLYEPIISEEILNMLPETSTLTILNIGCANQAIRPYTEDPLSYISYFPDDCELFMTVNCASDWIEEYQSKDRDPDYGQIFRFIGMQ